MGLNLKTERHKFGLSLKGEGNIDIRFNYFPGVALAAAYQTATEAFQTLAAKGMTLNKKVLRSGFYVIQGYGPDVQLYRRYHSFGSGVIGYSILWKPSAVPDGNSLNTLVSDLFRATYSLGLERTPPPSTIMIARASPATAPQTDQPITNPQPEQPSNAGTSTENRAWAAEATINPDYQKGEEGPFAESKDATPMSDAEFAAYLKGAADGKARAKDAAAKSTVTTPMSDAEFAAYLKGVAIATRPTDAAPHNPENPQNRAWAAEATINPDYQKGEEGPFAESKDATPMSDAKFAAYLKGAADGKARAKDAAAKSTVTTPMSDAEFAAYLNQQAPDGGKGITDMIPFFLLVFFLGLAGPAVAFLDRRPAARQPPPPPVMDEKLKDERRANAAIVGRERPAPSNPATRPRQVSDMDWYISRQGNTHGPLTFDDLISGARDGQLMRDDLVWCVGMKNWEIAEGIAGLWLPPSPPSAVAPIPPVEPAPKPLPSPVPEITENIVAATIEASPVSEATGVPQTLLGAGFIGPQTFVWREGDSSWVTLSNAILMQPAIPTAPPPRVISPQNRIVEKATAAWSADEPAPWRRYGARMLDTTIHGYIGVFFLGFAWYAIAPISAEAFFNFFATPSGVFLDIALSSILAAFVGGFVVGATGTSLGKAIFGIKVVNPDHLAIGIGAGLRREFHVWICGLGFGVPLIAMFTMFASFKKLKAEGETGWDKDRNVVLYSANSTLQKTLTAIGFCLVIALVILSRTMSAHS